MSKHCENCYKTCRKNAGLTQESAAESLHISPRTLSYYENNEGKVPDDVVSAMADVYKAPFLALLHLKQNSVLGKFLPEIVLPQTNGDMAFQLVLAQDNLCPAVAGIKQIMSDGRIDKDELDAFGDNIRLIQRVSGKLFSVVAFAEQM